ERGRRERLRATIRVVRSSPLFPGVKRSSKQTDRFLVAGPHGRVVIGARNRCPGGGRVAVERETRQRRQHDLRGCRRRRQRERERGSAVSKMHVVRVY